MVENAITPFLKENKIDTTKDETNTISKLTCFNKSTSIKRSKKQLKVLRDSVSAEYFEQLNQPKYLKNINTSSTRLSKITILISFFALLIAIISLYWQIKGF